MSSITLSAAFRALGDERMQEQRTQMRTAFVALLGALDREEAGEVRRALEHSDAPSRFHLEDRKSGTSLSLEIGARERGCPDRVVTLSFVLEGEQHILTVAQTRREWNERSPNVTILEGTPDDLLTLSAAMASAKASFDPEAVRNRSNNPILQKKEAASFGDALGKAFTQIRMGKGAHAHQVLVNILEKLDCAEKGEIREALRAYDRLSLFSYREGDLSIGLQIGPRGKQDAPRTVMLSVHRQDIPILEVSQTKCVWDEPFTEENPPAFHTGTLQTLLDLSSALNNPEALSKASMQEAPGTPALA